MKSMAEIKQSTKRFTCTTVTYKQNYECIPWKNRTVQTSTVEVIYKLDQIVPVCRRKTECNIFCAKHKKHRVNMPEKESATGETT